MSFGDQSTQDERLVKEGEVLPVPGCGIKKARGGGGGRGVTSGCVTAAARPFFPSPCRSRRALVHPAGKAENGPAGRGRVERLRRLQESGADLQIWKNTEDAAL